VRPKAKGAPPLGPPSHRRPRTPPLHPALAARPLPRLTGASRLPAARPRGPPRHPPIATAEDPGRRLAPAASAGGVAGARAVRGRPGAAQRPQVLRRDGACGAPHRPSPHTRLWPGGLGPRPPPHLGNPTPGPGPTGRPARARGGARQRERPRPRSLASRRQRDPARCGRKAKQGRVRKEDAWASWPEACWSVLKRLGFLSFQVLSLVLIARRSS
jgi:hypothetical protein